MSDGTRIEWADASVNTVYGCEKASPGCEHCYAIGQTRRLVDLGHSELEGLVRFGGEDCGNWCSRGKEPTGCNTGDCTWEWTGKVIVHPKATERLEQIVRWRKPRRIFINSMADTFHPDVPAEHIAAILNAAARAPQHTFLLLTKRPERMAEVIQRCADADGMGWITHDGTPPGAAYEGTGRVITTSDKWPLPNVWLGFTAEDQQRFDERWQAVRDLGLAGWRLFASCEPLVGPLDLFSQEDALWHTDSAHSEFCNCAEENTTCPIPVQAYGGFLRWVIVGGESGSGARPMHPAWVDSIRKQCQSAGVPFFAKNWGAWEPQYNFSKDGTRLLQITGLSKRLVILDDGNGAQVNMARVPRSGPILFDGEMVRDFPEGMER